MCGNSLSEYMEARTAGKASYVTLEREKISGVSIAPVGIEHHQKLSIFANELLTSEKEYSFEDTQESYMRHLSSAGYLTPVGKIRISKLVNDFKDKYGETFLDSIDCNVNENSSTNWIKKCLNPSYQYSLDPINNLLLINFLTESILDFFEYNKVYLLGMNHRGFRAVTETEIMAKREKLAIFFKKSYMTRSELSKNDNSLYRYFLKYDRIWFQEFMKEKAYSKSRAKNWLQEDEKYLRKCKKMYELLIFKNDKRRITPSLIVRLTKSGSIISYSSKLPKTTGYLQKITETYADARLRKYQGLADQAIGEGKIPTTHQVWGMNNYIDRKRFEEIEKELGQYIIRRVEKDAIQFKYDFGV